jgi:glutathione S-transferase
VYLLYIANKNYSSWSLRPWILMRELGLPFEEHLIPFGDDEAWSAYRKTSAAGKVPCLVDGERTVWESLAIVEYLAERHAVVWSPNATARAWSRSAASEMHAGFSELRTRCPMTCGVRVRLKERPPALERDLARISQLWNQGLDRFGGPYLAGAAFTAVDAFFAPVAFRVQTYDLTLDPAAAAYAARLLGLDGMQEWYAAALRETLRDEPHDEELLQFGTVLQDLRAPADLKV